uniref:Uncharacterized protein n=1 Tax=Psilocybe cubensis TaxID=181762 RepID=A0A8H8CIQ9_PSICU
MLQIWYQQQLQHPPLEAENANVSPPHFGGPGSQIRVQAILRVGLGTLQHLSFPQHPGPPMGAKPAGQIGGERLHSRVQILSEAAAPETKARTETTRAECFIDAWLNVDVFKFLTGTEM